LNSWRSCVVVPCTAGETKTAARGVVRVLYHGRSAKLAGEKSRTDPSYVHGLVGGAPDWSFSWGMEMSSIGPGVPVGTVAVFVRDCWQLLRGVCQTCSTTTNREPDRYDSFPLSIGTVTVDCDAWNLAGCPAVTSCNNRVVCGLNTQSL
jgi:hypothetical protein